MKRRSFVKGTLGLSALAISGLGGESARAGGFFEKLPGKLTLYNAAESIPRFAYVSNPASLALAATHNNECVPISANDIANQFIPFQGVKVNGKPTLVEPTSVEPSLQTTDQNPDVKMDVSMEAFHLGESDQIDKDTKATLVLTLNKDDASPRARQVETLFWAATTGLNLWNGSKNKRTTAPDLTADYSKAFGNRAVEIPGGLGNLKLQVIKHNEPAWWTRIFKFFAAAGGTALTASLGFPAITQDAVQFVDDLIDRLNDCKPEVLFRSRQIRLAFSKQAREAYTGGDQFSRIVPGLFIPMLFPFPQLYPFFDFLQNLLATHFASPLFQNLERRKN